MTYGKDLPYLLSIDEQALLTLVRIRLGLQFQDLGKRFGISHQLASRNFNSWINILAVQLIKRFIKRFDNFVAKGHYSKISTNFF